MAQPMGVNLPDDLPAKSSKWRLLELGEVIRKSDMCLAMEEVQPAWAEHGWSGYEVKPSHNRREIFFARLKEGEEKLWLNPWE